MKTKLFSLFLMLMISIGTIFASNSQVNGIWYNFNDYTLTAQVTYRGSSYSAYSNEYSGAVTIPSSVTYNGNTYSVTSIGEYAFFGCSGLTSVSIPNSVASIGAGALYDCTGLTSVTIPNSVTSIGKSAFYGCTGLTSVDISDIASWCAISFLNEQSNPLYLAHNLYENGNLIADLVIPSNVTRIGDYAFQNCTGLTSVTIPNSVTFIGQRAFNYCTGLTSVHISDIASWCAINFSNVTSNPLCCAHNLYLSGSLITDLVIPNSVTIIKSYAFSFCTGLTSVTIPNSVTDIEEEAFRDCTGLTSVHIFDLASWCAINFIKYYSNPLCYAHNLYLSGSLITNLVIPEGVASIGKSAFLGCYCLTSLTIPNSITDIGEGAFRSCKGLASVTLPNSVTSIGEAAFYLCTGLTSVTTEAFTPPTLGGNNIFPNGIPIYVPCGTLSTYKAAWSVYRNAVQYLSVPYVIYAAGFYEHGRVEATSYATICDNMPVLTAMPDSGCHFVQWSDGNTENPRTVILTQDTTITAEFAIDKSGTCGENMALNWAFEDSTKTLIISGSGALTENYTYGLEAPTQMEHLVIGNDVTAIGDSAFYGKTTIAQVTIGGNVTSIGNYAFANIDNRQLTSIVMPVELTTIGDYAFSGNTYLESIDFNAKLLSIGAYAFKDCRRVSEMTCMAETTPDVGTNALSSINSYASLCVPASCVRKYQVDPNWGRFDLCELGATTSTGSVTTVTVEPSDNTALFTWPTENDAATYTLQITKDGEVFCTLVFNANGQLTGIAFAPSRTGTPHAPAATLANGAMQFTVTGLNVANKYAYRLAVTDASNVEQQSYSGEFATTGYEGEVNPGGDPESGHEAVDQLHQDPDSMTHKLLRNGQILILRGDRTYTVTGQELK